MEDSIKLVYANCKLSQLTTILQILKLQVVHGWTNESLDELFSFFSWLLPCESTLPTKQSQCRKKITKLGLWYENIYTCVNGCVLFCKNLASEIKCPKCQEGRYKPRFKLIVVPIKVLLHFQSLVSKEEFDTYFLYFQHGKYPGLDD